MQFQIISEIWGAATTLLIVKVQSMDNGMTSMIQLLHLLTLHKA
jgi:hypothetical protein